MMSRVAMVAGATGLIGHQVLQLLLKDDYYSKVFVLSRSPLQIVNAKIENIILQIGEWHKLQPLKADDIFCCLGTTIKKARTKEAFRKVDYEYPVELARASKGNGARQFLLISSLGVDAHSRIFYNRVKGETEAAISAIGFDTLHILRPPLLLGERSEQRSGEDAAKLFYKIFGFLIPQRYKAIDSARVARAMVAYAKSETVGVCVHESDVLQLF